MDEDIYKRLCRAREFMDDCYGLPLTLDQISREACISPYHFHRLFRQTFEQTPHQYLTDRRIRRAKELLESKAIAVTDVCFEVGFQSLGSFITLFRKHVGHSPRTYRRIFIVRQPLSRIPACFIFMFTGKPVA
jgi:AraC-like DNA-binding protein